VADSQRFARFPESPISREILGEDSRRIIERIADAEIPRAAKFFQR